MDEQNHLARGLAFLRTGDPRFSLEHPPLINAISALPLLTVEGIRLPIDHPSWNQPQGWYIFAEQLLWEYNEDVSRMIFLARIPIVFLTLALALVGYRFSLNFWGPTAALFSFLIILFDPNILAHGRYTTSDIGGATFLLLCMFALWRMWRAETGGLKLVIVGGITLGLALGAKMSNLVFVPIFAVMALLPIYGGQWSGAKALKRFGIFAMAVLISLGGLWMIFAFERGPLNFSPFGLSLFERLSLPMPTYWNGVGQILQISGGGRPSFLLGKFSTQGWWYYFPVAFMVKTPVLLILLVVVAVFLLLRERTYRGRAIFLLGPAAGFFLISMISALNIGYRHLLPMLPMLYVLVGGLALLATVSRFGSIAGRLALRILLIGALVSIILVDTIIHPHYLSYFNVVSGGPNNGHRILVDSNIDWGQDLLRLRQWIDDNDVERIKLSWFGTADPEYYGIQSDPLPGLTHHFDLWWNVPFNPSAPEPGIYAISVSNLWERPLEDKTVFRWFREREPDDKVGYSINIYFVGENG
jgi:hypothetical protein